MKITVLYIGKKSKNLYESAEAEFSKRLSRYCKLQRIGIQPSRKSSALPVGELLKEEAGRLRQKIPPGSLLVLLDENGTALSSRKFARQISRWQMTSSHICFVVGGAYGFEEKLKNEAAALISLSAMTLPHHLARLVFLEQLYRAFTILNNESYHND